MYKTPRTILRAFQSTLPAWGETQKDAEDMQAALISIHSPRMGRDGIALVPQRLQQISIHSPRMGRDWDAIHADL